QALDEIVATLVPHYGADCPAALVYRASWPDEQVIRAPLGELTAPGIRRSATILVGPALAARDFRDSHLYSKARER
ncbi:MAG TPA: hypothetical protein VFZ89_20010, partial [Solirubrobacteraceae bacterium]